jgi:hypothetical protein
VESPCEFGSEFGIESSGTIKRWETIEWPLDSAQLQRVNVGSLVSLPQICYTFNYPSPAQVHPPSFRSDSVDRLRFKGLPDCNFAVIYSPVKYVW